MRIRQALILALIISTLIIACACIQQREEEKQQTNENKTTMNETKQDAQPTEKTTTSQTQANRTTETKEKKTADELENPFNELIAKAPKNYWFIETASDDRGVVAYGNQRSIGEYDYNRDNMFWDTDTNILYLCTWQIAESWWLERTKQSPKEGSRMGASKYLPAFLKIELTGDKTKDNELLPMDLLKRSYFISDPKDRTKVIQNFYVKSPIDWMEQYKNEKPIKIETTPYSISLLKKQVSSNLAVHFKYPEDPTKTIIFRFDPKYNLPLYIEIVDGHRTVERYRFLFDTIWYDEGGLVKKEVSEELVKLPEDHIIVTAKDIEDYLNHIEKSR